MENRREFVTKLLKGTVYTAPVVKTLAAPDGLLAQENYTSTKGGMGAGMLMEMMGGMLVAGGSSAGLSASPASGSKPWEKKPGG